MPAAGPRPGAIAAQLETLADWVEEQDGDSIAGQSAAACRHIAMQARQDRQDSQAVTIAGLLADLFPHYDIGRAAGLWVAFPLADPARVLTAGTPHRLAGAIIADEATRS